MADKVLLITAQYIKDNSIINENVDNKYISNTVVMCQDLNLQQIIGSDLYLQIKAQVVAVTLTALNTTLLQDYIQPFLLNQVLADIIIPATYKIANKGIVKKDDQAASVIDRGDIQLLKGDFDNKAQFYGERLRKYLLHNSSDYPLYLTGNTTIDTMRPMRTAYQSGIFTGNKRCHNRHRGPGFTDGDHCCD